MFDLLQLNNKEKDKNMKGSWIKTKGKNLNKLVSEIIDDLRNAGFTKRSIVSELSKKWNCHKRTAKRHVYYSCKRNNWVALSFISELIDIWKNWLKKSLSEKGKR